jgi:small subunit ribosomal protein S11
MSEEAEKAKAGKDVKEVKDVKEPKDVKEGKEPKDGKEVKETKDGKEVKKVKIKKRASAIGIAFIRSTFNNTIITITDQEGNTVAWGSCGRAGFKGSRKSMPYSATVAADQVGRVAVEAGVRTVEVRIKGGGAGREAAIRALKMAGLEITAIKDLTATPHNGCRPPKRRRI